MLLDSSGGSHTQHDTHLIKHLRTFLGDLEPAAIELLVKKLTWVEVAAGETLMVQGDPGHHCRAAGNTRRRSAPYGNLAA